MIVPSTVFAIFMFDLYMVFMYIYIYTFDIFNISLNHFKNVKVFYTKPCHYLKWKIMPIMEKRETEKKFSENKLSQINPRYMLIPGMALNLRPNLSFLKGEIS